MEYELEQLIAKTIAAYMRYTGLTEIKVSDKQFEDALNDAEKLVIYPDVADNMCIRIMPADEAETFVENARNNIANRSKELKNV